MAWVALAVFVLFVAVPLIRAAVEDSNGGSGASEESDDLSAHDQAIVAKLGSYVADYNAAALPFISDYLDPTVSALSWVRSAGEDIDRMQEAASAMEADVLSIQDDRLRRTLFAQSELLREEVGAAVELRLAVAHLDPRAERTAYRHIRRVAAQRRQMALELLDRLRPYLDPETLRELLQTAAQGT